MVDLDERRTGRPTSGAAVAAQWFAQPIFGDADLEDEDEAPPASTTGRQQPKPVPAAAAAPQALAKTSTKASVKGKPTNKATAEGDPLTGVTALPSQRVKAAGAATLAAAAADAVAEGASVFASSGSDAGDSSDNDDSMPDAARLASHSAAEPSGSKSGFEEVPVSRQHATAGAASSDELSDDGFSDLDDDGKAEVLALAKKMLRGRDRQDILDGAYHRYAFHESGLPDWFEADERRHMK